MFCFTDFKSKNSVYESPKGKGKNIVVTPKGYRIEYWKGLIDWMEKAKSDFLKLHFLFLR